MKQLRNTNTTSNCWNRFEIEYAIWDVFMYFCFLSLFLTQPKTENLWITKLATRTKVDLTKYPREKYLDSWNTHEKNMWRTKYPRSCNDTIALESRNPPCHGFIKFNTLLSGEKVVFERILSQNSLRKISLVSKLIKIFSLDVAIRPLPDQNVQSHN